MIVTLFLFLRILPTPRCSLVQTTLYGVFNMGDLAVLQIGSLNYIILIIKLSGSVHNLQSILKIRKRSKIIIVLSSFYDPKTGMTLQVHSTVVLLNHTTDTPFIYILNTNCTKPFPRWAVTWTTIVIFTQFWISINGIYSIELTDLWVSRCVLRCFQKYQK